MTTCDCEECQNNESQNDESALISLKISGNEDGLNFELVVQSDNLKEVEEVFNRTFDRIQYLLNGKRDERKEVI
ncbi:hypothetical protein DRO24_03610 [Candidatus Bathyarchaeota archaeon]|nr:MAG: hypothetical protein DRO24_03610 [Candidatus Bathyarchaeota archaeon]